MKNRNIVPGISYYNDFCGASAMIIEHRDGTATISWKAGNTRGKSTHKNFNAARAKWYRLCN